MPAGPGLPKKQNGSGLSFPWAHYISRDGWLDQVSLSVGQSHGVFLMIINWEDLDEAIRALLGYSFKDSTTGALRRVLPWRHPHFEHMYCDGITAMKGVSWDGKEFNAYGPWSSYKFAILTLSFSVPQFSILSDSAAGGQEWKRFVIRRPQPRATMIQRQGGDYVWSHEVIVNGLAGKDVQAPLPVGTVLHRQQITLVWQQVPSFPGVQDADENFPNIDNCVGCVNNAPFLGKATGTLLFEGYNPHPTSIPVPLQEGGAPAVGTIPRYWDIELHFHWQDPPFGGNARGWNVIPGPGDRLWYKPVTKRSYDAGANAEDALYDSVDLSGIFLMV